MFILLLHVNSADKIFLARKWQRREVSRVVKSFQFEVFHNYLKTFSVSVLCSFVYICKPKKTYSSACHLVNNDIVANFSQSNVLQICR